MLDVEGIQLLFSRGNNSLYALCYKVLNKDRLDALILPLNSDTPTIAYDNELMRVAKFMQRSLNTFIATHGVRVGMGLDSGARFLDEVNSANANADAFEARGKKKKQRWSMILPLALMLKLVHMKLLLKPILLGVGLIQVLLIVGGFLIFNYFRHNNVCRIQPHLIHSHSHIASESSPGKFD